MKNGERIYGVASTVESDKQEASVQQEEVKEQYEKGTAEGKFERERRYCLRMADACNEGG